MYRIGKKVGLEAVEVATTLANEISLHTAWMTSHAWSLGQVKETSVAK
jgi:hypothetical protein